MFEVTIRTDDQDALHKLMEFITSLNWLIYKGPTTDKNGKPVAKIIVEVPQNTPGFQEFTSKTKGWAKGPIPLPAGIDKPSEDLKSGFGCMKGMFEMAADFDEPLEDFKEYMY